MSSLLGELKLNETKTGKTAENLKINVPRKTGAKFATTTLLLFMLGLFMSIPMHGCDSMNSSAVVGKQTTRLNAKKDDDDVGKSKRTDSSGELFVAKHRVQGPTGDQSRVIQVYLPPEYERQNRRYPVLYVLDGQRYLAHGIAYQTSLHEFDISPTFIVVGIECDMTARRHFFGNGSNQYLRFLERDVIPMIEGKYRTTEERILFGWEMAGGFAVQVFAQRPGLFTAFFAASPTNLEFVVRDDDKSKSRIELVKDRISKEEVENELLFFSLSPSESWALKSVEQLADLLEKHGKPKLRWKYDLMPEESHHTTPARTIHNGLKQCFEDYSPVRYETWKEFESNGGFEGLKEIYRKRAKRYGVSDRVGLRSIGPIVRATMRDDNYPAFLRVFEEFDHYLEIQRYANWYPRFAGFHRKHGQLDRAIHALETGIRRFPDHAPSFHALGGLYKEKGKLDEATTCYERAVHLAKSQSLPILAQIQKDLESLKN